MTIPRRKLLKAALLGGLAPVAGPAIDLPSSRRGPLKISLNAYSFKVSEEPGMEWVVPWLKPIVGDIKVTHIPSGDPYSGGWG
jgi:hypothetical protein